MSLKIFSNDEDLASTLVSILQHYFPSHSTESPHHLHIATKYYTCKVPIELCRNFQTFKVDNQGRTDMVVFLFGQDEVVEGIGARVDTIMAELSPEAAIVCVAGREREGEWHHQEELAQCQNFVSVLYEDLEAVAKVLPKWSQGGLLEDSGEQCEIFSLLEMLETTQWTNMQKKGSKQAEETHREQYPEAKEPKIGNKNEQEPNQMEEQQMTEQQMEAEMAQFQKLMQQMMSIKAMPSSDAQRKKMAEDLILKMAGSMAD